MEKKPRFFCDFCGNEVHQNDLCCTHCGKFFSAVRCPSCGKTGSAALFSNGCPQCGYAFKKGGDSQKSQKKYFRGLSSNTKTMQGDPLPIWVYIATICVVVVLVVVSTMYCK